MNCTKKPVAMKTLFFLLIFGCLFSKVVSADDTLIYNASTWYYNDTGTDLHYNGWPLIDGSQWPEGVAQLGYGDGDETTELSYGPDLNNKYPCYYFQQTFEVTDPSLYETLTLLVLHDDGCLVFINGQEAARSNMPTGTITYDTWANSAVGGADESAWHEFTIDAASVLTEGINTVAVEIHQANATSSDISFDLELIGVPAPPPVPTVTLTAPADGEITNQTAVTFKCSASDEVGLSYAQLYLGGDPITTTFTGPEEIDDAQISSDNSGTNYGSSVSINIDGDNPHAHAVIKFPNLIGNGANQIPSGAIITSAQLELYCTNEGDVMEVRQLIQDWTEDAVTWNDRTADQTWAAPGADGYGSCYSEPVIEAEWTEIGWHTIDITEFVQHWSDESPNFGLLFSDTGGTDGVDFDSSESDNSPVLTVSYQPGWEWVQTQDLSGTDAAVIFNPVILEDKQEYTWNCRVTNTVGEQAWAAFSFYVTVDTDYPDIPLLVAPSDGATGVSTSPILEADVSDPQDDDLAVSFFGRKSANDDEFTIIVLPDTQTYSQSYPDIFTEQTQWIVDNKDTLNIAFVIHEGDIVNTWDDEGQWESASYSMSLLDGVVPYSVVPGDHDHYGEDPNGSTQYYEQYFPASRFNGYSWWGGNFTGNFGDENNAETDNNNNYQLLTIGGKEFLFLSLDFCPSQDEIDWANSIVSTYSDRLGILTTHGLLDTNADYYGSGDFWLYPDGSSNPTGDTSLIWHDLIKLHPNLRIALCGHMHGESRRTDNNNAGKPVYQILANYQSRGDEGWLRIMRFSAADNTIYVQTYSPTLNQYEEDANSQFTIDFPMNDFIEIGTDTVAAGGGTASISWPDRELDTSYEWYVTVTDPTGNSTTGPIWEFTTTANDTEPPVISNVAAVNITDNSANIEWETDEAADSTVDYGEDTNYGEQETDSSLVISHSILLDNLTPNTTYHYQVTSMDASGNTEVSADFVFTTEDVNHPPVAGDQSVTTDEDTDCAVVLTATDNDGDELTYSIVSSPTKGSLTGTAPNLIYEPNDDLNGEDSFSFQASDGQDTSNTATVSITITPVNDAPVADSQDVTVSEDGSVNITLTASDIDSGSLSYTLASDPLHGALSGTPPNLTYTPVENYYGEDSFDFYASDGVADSNPATISITVSPVNDAPAAQDQELTTVEDDYLEITLTASDIDNDPLTFSIVDSPAHGTLTGAPPSVTYTPDLNYSGDDSFTFKANDGDADSNTATISLSIASVDDIPAQPQNLSATAGNGVVELSWDPNDEPENDLQGYQVFRSTTSGTYGDPLITQTETTFSDSNVENGTTYYYVVRAVDTANQTSPASAEVSAEPQSVNYDAYASAEPTATLAEVTGTVDGTYEVGDGLQQACKEQPNGPAGSSGLDVEYQLVTAAASADVSSVVLHLDSSWTNLDADDELLVAVWNGSSWEDITTDILDADKSCIPSGLPGDYVSVDGVIRVRFTDGASVKKESKDTLTIDLLYAEIDAQSVPGNNPPVAGDDTALTDEDTPASIPVLANDTDPDEDPLSIVTATDGDFGAVEIDGDDIIYTPNPDWYGTDSFTYIVTDGNGGTDEGLVTVTITAVNDAPSAYDDTATTQADTDVIIPVLDNDDDPDADDLTVVSTTEPSNGTVTINADNTITYTPDSGFTSGEDTFSYTISDGNDGSDTATVTITVSSVQLMWIDSISMGLIVSGINYEATADVAVLSDSDVPADGAAVTGNWYLGTSGDTTDTLIASDVTQTTGSDGTVQFVSPKEKAKNGEVFTFEVTGVSKTGYQYDPDAGITTNSITVQ